MLVTLVLRSRGLVPAKQGDESHRVRVDTISEPRTPLSALPNNQNLALHGLARILHQSTTGLGVID